MRENSSALPLLFWFAFFFCAQIQYQISARIHKRFKQLRGLFAASFTHTLHIHTFFQFSHSLACLLTCFGFGFYFGKCKLIFYGNLWNDFLAASVLVQIYIAIDNHFIALRSTRGRETERKNEWMNDSECSFSKLELSSNSRNLSKSLKTKAASAAE